MASELANWITGWIYELMPLFRVAWMTTILFGVALLVVAFILKRNPARKTSPWVTGGIGLVMFISSGTQLLFSLV